MASQSAELTELLIHQFKQFHNAIGADAKASFLAEDFRVIDRYLHGLLSSPDRAAFIKGDCPTKENRKSYGEEQESSSEKHRVVTARALNNPDISWSDDEVGRAGFASAAELQRLITDGGWVGLLVDSWLPARADWLGLGFLMRSQYWFDRRGGKWLLVLRDDIEFGPVDGTEGKGGTYITDSGENVSDKRCI